MSYLTVIRSHDRKVTINYYYYLAKLRSTKTELECGPMPNVMAALHNIEGANEERNFRNSLPDAYCSSAAQ